MKNNKKIIEPHPLFIRKGKTLTKIEKEEHERIIKSLAKCVSGAYELNHSLSNPILKKDRLYYFISILVDLSYKLEDFIRSDRESFTEIVKDFKAIPLLLSGVRKDNNARLESLYLLPLGENLPFKSSNLGSATLGDARRDYIYNMWEYIEEARTHPSKYKDEFRKYITGLVPISRKSSRIWAKLMAKISLESNSRERLYYLFVKNNKSNSQVVQKAKKRIINKHGGPGIYKVHDPVSGIGFIDKNGQALEITEAQRLYLRTKRIKDLRNTPLNDEQRLSNLIDAIDDKLHQMLK